MEKEKIRYRYRIKTFVADEDITIPPGAKILESYVDCACNYHEYENMKRDAVTIQWLEPVCIQEEEKSELKGVSISDLVNELLEREEVISRTVSHGERFPDISHDEWNIRTGPAKIIIIRTFKRKDGYK